MVNGRPGAHGRAFKILFIWIIKSEEQRAEAFALAPLKEKSI